MSNRFEAPAYAALRIVAGLMLSQHGFAKILGWFAATWQPEFGSQLWIGGVIELAAGLLIAAGLFTRVAAFVAAGTMAVAYFQFHWKLKFAGWQWAPTVNQGELAALYCFVFLLFATRGAGVASLDQVLRKR
jgi:putative oxidoreductase